MMMTSSAMNLSRTQVDYGVIGAPRAGTEGDAQARGQQRPQGSRIGEQVDGLRSAQMLIALFLAMRVAERNTDQAYRTRHDAMVFERGVTARTEKYNANRSHYNAGLMSAIGGIVSGSFSLVGGVGSGAAGFGGELGKLRMVGTAVGETTKGVSQFVKSPFDVVSNDDSLAGRDNDVLGEFEMSLSEETRRTNERLRQRIDATSADIRDVSRSMYGMIGQQVTKMYDVIR
ncbi:hypothetical protein AB870_10245 [Pandoraea faecigallinarum]|uniref:Uncharacterized protein n=1 Tax=Pandoraea faecigallinarum TaxID=656179 RepID=A0A0H3WS10_9BURK|nr:hypothetical protein [Pandoraea faecigallinarum]AKM30405.1 hypothetical protein AB870_10245 [Pandoraea faecigallinarum]